MTLKSKLNKIPAPIKLFLGKALLFFIFWKVIYAFFLNTSSYSIDNMLTKHVGVSSVYVLNNLTTMSGFTTKEEIAYDKIDGEVVETIQKNSEIYHNGHKILNIADACNGLELIILYIGFIVCMPSKITRKILYIILGVIAIDLVNITRCVGLIYLREYFQLYFEFAHHYLFKIMVYTSIFLIWVLFSRKIDLKDEAIQVK